MNHGNENSSSARQAIFEQRPSIRSRHLVWQWTAITGFVIAYLVLEWISFIHEYKGLPLTPWNPGLGLAFACLILIGPHYGIALFVGIIVAEIVVLQSNLEWTVIVGIAAIIASGYAFVATVIREQFRLDVGLTHLRDVIILLAAGFVGATGITLLLVAVLLAVGELGFADIVRLHLPLSSAMSSVLLSRRRSCCASPDSGVSRRSICQWRGSLKLLCSSRFIIIALWLIARTESADGYRLFYLFFLPVVFIAVRHGLDGACLALAATQFGLVGLLHHHGYDWWIFMQFQVLMFVLTATGLIVGVVVSERQQTERVARESEARLKEKEAEVAHAARFSLVSGMASALAHEINQPMAAARALGRSVQELLRSPQADLTRADRNLTTLIAEIDLASGILRRMRDFLRRGRPQISTIDVLPMLDDTLMLIRPEAMSKNVMIDLDCPADLPAVYGDRIQVQQVVLNLVRNAVDSIVESGQSNGRIQITARRPDDSADLVEIGVLDNGPGIPADLVDHLFKPLTTSKKEGLGLGLSICFAIAEAHGGRIWLHSNRPVRPNSAFRCHSNRLNRRDHEYFHGLHHRRPIFDPSCPWRDAQCIRL